MNTTKLQQQRLEILDKIEELKNDHCNGCKLMEIYKDKSQTTERANACKVCPISAIMRDLGEELLITTKIKRNFKKTMDAR